MWKMTVLDRSKARNLASFFQQIRRLAGADLVTRWTIFRRIGTGQIGDALFVGRFGTVAKSLLAGSGFRHERGWIGWLGKRPELLQFNRLELVRMFPDRGPPAALLDAAMS